MINGRETRRNRSGPHRYRTYWLQAANPNSPCAGSELANELHHLVLPFSADLGEHWQRQNPALLTNCVGKFFRTVAQAGIGREKRQCDRIIDRGLNTIGVEMRGERIAPGMLDR